jgi:hypothetical protein
MLVILIALVLGAVSVGGIYLLLRSMGLDGVEAAAPGSCKSGKCGARPRNADEAGVHEQYVPIGEIKRTDSFSNNRDD